MNTNSLFFDLLLSERDELYCNKFLTYAVLCSLTHDAKLFIFQFIFFEKLIDLDNVTSSRDICIRQEQLRMLAKLADLRIFDLSSFPDEKKLVSLNREFREQILIIFYNGLTLCSLPYKMIGTEFEPDSKVDTLNTTEDFKMVIFLEKLFIISGLWTRFDEHGCLITSHGIKFLLADMHTQAWVLLREFLRMNYEDENSKGILCFIIQLLISQMGRLKNINSLFCYEKVTIEKLSFIGLIRLDGERLYPTKYLFSLFWKNDYSCSDGFIIVETNFRIYGETTCLLRSALIRFFSEPDGFFPNLYVGVITRTSCQKAFEAGVTADIILSFIKQNAHPKILNRLGGILPETFVDQIRLWELEFCRLQTEPAILLDRFENLDLFRKTEIRAIELGIKIHSSLSKQLLVVRSYNKDLINSLINFIRKNKLDKINISLSD